MKRIATLLIMGLAAGPVLASDNTRSDRAVRQPASAGSGSNLSTKDARADLRQSAPGELRISPNNDSR